MKLSLLTGGCGCVNVTDTALVEGEFVAVQVLEDAQFEELEDRSAAGGDIITGKTHPADRVLWGDFRRVKLVSGSVRAYKRNRV